MNSSVDRSVWILFQLGLGLTPLLIWMQDFPAHFQVHWLRTWALAFLAFSTYRLGLCAAILRHPVFMGLLVFLSYSWLSVVWSTNSFAAIQASMHWSTVVLASYLIAQGLLKWGDADWLWRSTAFSATIASIMMIAQFWWDVDFGIQQAAPPAAMFVNKNMASQFLLFGVACNLGLLLTATSRAQQWVLGVCLGVVATALLYAVARAAYLGAASMLVLLAVVFTLSKATREHVAKRTAGLGVAFAMLVVLSPFDSSGFNPHGMSRYVSKVESIVGENGLGIGDAKGNIRLAMWDISASMIKANPFAGVGAGNWSVHYPRYQKQSSLGNHIADGKSEPKNAHNEYLEVVAEFGLVGVLVLLALMILIFRAIALQCRSERFSHAPIIALLALTGTAVDGLFSFPLHKITTAVLFGLCIGVLLRDGHTVAQSSPVVKIQRGVAAGLIGLFTLISLTFALSSLDAHREFLRAKNAIDQGAATRGLKHAKAANERFPRESYYYRATANAYRMQGRHSEAIEAIDVELAGYPYRMGALYFAGDSAMLNKSYTQAISYYSRAVELAPSALEPNRRLAIAFHLDGQHAEAKRHMQAAVDTDRDFMEKTQFLGFLQKQ